MLSSDKANRLHKSSARLGGRRRASNFSYPSRETNLSAQNRALPYAYRASPRHPRIPRRLSTWPGRDEHLPGVDEVLPHTEFAYFGSVQDYGWRAGQVPLFLEWYPEKLDRRSTLKFFESGREYIFGRSPTCDIFFRNAEADSGISAKHLKIKTLLIPGPVSRIYVWVTDISTNGTYINGVQIAHGEPVQLCPDDHVTILKRDNASDSRPNIGFRIVMALQKPKIDDYYAILKGGMVGSGTFGAVHKARNLETGDIVAVKVIQALRGSSLSQDLEREIRIMKKLDHPNIVQFRDSFEETKEHMITRYIVMEFIEGGTLHDAIQVSDEISEATIRHIILQILGALEYMHDHHHVSHRDLKPANILLCDRGLYPTIKIADLGLAKIEAASKNNTFCGSPGYLAPECTQGPQVHGLNWTMDIYAVGVITYELYPPHRAISDARLTGKRPFGTDMKKDPYARKLPMAPLLRRRCSEEVIDFMCRLLSFDPAARPTAREVILHPWLLIQDHSNASPRDQQPLPSDETTGPLSKTIRATPRLSSSDSSDSFSSSTSPPSSSSVTSLSASSGGSEDEKGLSTVRQKGSLKLPPASSFFSDRMDVCSIRTNTCIRAEDTAVLRTASPMRIDTMIPAERIWCILHPCPGNAAGTSALFLKKSTTIVGSDTGADIVLRHPKVADHHCTIMTGSWNKENGLTGIIHVHDKKPLRFRHKSTIYILQDQKHFISYMVEFPGSDDNTTSMTQAMGRMEISGPRCVKRKLNHFSPYMSKRGRNPDITTITPTRLSQAETVPLRQATSVNCQDQAPAMGSSPSLTISQEPESEPWGVLISKTIGYVDIPLCHQSTLLGELCHFVDMHSGEWLEQYSYSIFRSLNGTISVRAVKPVIVDDTCLTKREKMDLRHGQSLSLCEEDLTLIAQYELRVYS